MDVGAELARARERRGLTLEEASRRTRVNAARLEAIERNDVDALPSLLYLKGFLRAFATEVGLDPDDIAERYLTQFDSAALLEFDSEEPGSTGNSVPPSAPNEELNHAGAGQAGSLPSKRPPREPPDVVADLPMTLAPTSSLVSLGGAPPSQRSFSHRRWAIGVGLAVIIGFLASAAVFRPSPRTGPGQAAPADSRVAPPDTARPAEVPLPTETRTRASDVATPAPTAQPAAAASLVTIREPARLPGLPVREEATGDVVRADARRDIVASGIGGSWTVVTRIAPSGATSDELTLGHRLRLEQRGTRVTGTGQRWSENGIELDAAERTVVTVDGTITGRRLELTVTEPGRTDRDTFVLELSEDGLLRGRFASGGATQGRSFAKRLPPPTR